MSSNSDNVRTWALRIATSLILALSSWNAWAQDVVRGDIRIGVLAKQGTAVCLQRWAPTARYLEKRIPGRTFRIVPLSFDALFQKVADQDVELLNEVIHDFVRETEDLLRALQRAVEQGDHPAVYEQAHALKGTAATVSASELHALALQVELAGRAGNDKELKSLPEACSKALIRTRQAATPPGSTFE